jgi:hypothetical protein
MTRGLPADALWRSRNGNGWARGPHDRGWRVKITEAGRRALEWETAQ